MADGFSKPWQDALSQMTGSPEMTASSFIKYFTPLYDFLEQENMANGACIGWGGKYLMSYKSILNIFITQRIVRRKQPQQLRNILTRKENFLSLLLRQTGSTIQALVMRLKQHPMKLLKCWLLLKKNPGRPSLLNMIMNSLKMRI